MNKFICYIGSSLAGTAELRDAVNIASYQAGYELVRTDEQSLTKEPLSGAAREAIKLASLVIGEMAGSNAVLVELGFAVAMGRPILLITQDPGKIPYLLSDVRAVTYQPGAPLASLVARLVDAISSTALGASGGPGAAHRNGKRDRVFFSYSHADAAYLDRMLVHLRPVERTGAVTLWSDTRLQAGDRWRDEIKGAVDAARVAVLLVSADFLASEFIVTNELPPLLTAAELEGARIIPILVKPSRFVRDASLSGFQALNDPKLPLIKMAEADREELYAKLAEVIEIELGI